jgi:acetyl esterase/lipase
VGGSVFIEGAAAVDAYVIKVKGKEDKKRPCLINFHGGGAIAGTAEQVNEIMCRYAVESDTTIVNVDYRLAPETKAPGGINDAYASVKWVIDNAEKLNIDEHRIAIMGESGGGYITAGCAMRLAERNEGHLVKF